MKLANLDPSKVMSRGAQTTVIETSENKRKNLVSAMWKRMANEWAFVDRGFFTACIALDEAVSKKICEGGGGGVLDRNSKTLTTPPLP